MNSVFVSSMTWSLASCRRCPSADPCCLWLPASQLSGDHPINTHLGPSAMNSPANYPIGTPGTAWGAAEVAEWRALQRRQRSYQDEVLSAIDALRSRFDLLQYGHLDHDPARYPLYAIKSRDWREELPIVLVTGGVHGYETSGVHGALRFLDRHAQDYAGRVNLIVAPCLSPWAYEMIHRWNRDAVDPNRSFPVPRARPRNPPR